MVETALELGLISRVLPPAEVNAYAQSQAQKMARHFLRLRLRISIDLGRRQHTADQSQFQSRLNHERLSHQQGFSGAPLKPC